MRMLAPAALLLVTVAFWWRSQQSAPGQGGASTLDPYAPDADWQPEIEDTNPTWIDEVDATYSVVKNMILPTAVATMTTSATGLAHIAEFEGLSLTRYRLGDGGWTIGRGRYYPDGGPLPPERIDLATADAWFAQDVRERGERWVKAYVNVPLTQPQFDALVSMAYNLSPKSFRTIAEAVNAGNDPEAAAMRFVRAGTDLERGLRRRRTSELALFRSDASTYA